MISVGCLSPGLNKRFREATGVDDPRATPGFDMGSESGRVAITAMVESAEAIMRTRSTADWLAHFRNEGVPAGPFNFPTEAVFEEQAEANGFVVDFDHPVLGPYRTFGNLVRMDGTPAVIQGPSPSLGVHTREVLAELGYDAVTIDDFMEHRVAGPGELG
jgi:crotonobetainyl-CoA:carnitine CoA-transferase CaiB-like acyl-CoA transferase